MYVQRVFRWSIPRRVRLTLLSWRNCLQICCYMLLESMKIPVIKSYNASRCESCALLDCASPGRMKLTPPISNQLVRACSLLHLEDRLGAEFSVSTTAPFDRLPPRKNLGNSPILRCRRSEPSQSMVITMMIGQHSPVDLCPSASHVASWPSESSRSSRRKK